MSKLTSHAVPLVVVTAGQRQDDTAQNQKRPEPGLPATPVPLVQVQSMEEVPEPTPQFSYLQLGLGRRWRLQEAPQPVADETGAELGHVGVTGASTGTATGGFVGAATGAATGDTMG